MKEKTLEELSAMYDVVYSPVFAGLRCVRHNGKEFHIRPDGTPAYAERFDHIGSFSNGLAWVRDGGKEFHIRTDGLRFN